MKSKKNKKTVMDKKLDLRVYHGCELHFNDYLRQQVGAGWYFIRNMMYDMGCSAGEVFEYREGLLKDFRKLCKQNGYVPMIYK